MNIIASRQEKRRSMINQVKASILKCFAENKSFAFNDMVMLICSSQGISRRTAIEYLNVALVEVIHSNINGVISAVVKNE